MWCKLGQRHLDPRHKPEVLTDSTNRVWEQSTGQNANNFLTSFNKRKKHFGVQYFPYPKCSEKQKQEKQKKFNGKGFPVPRGAAGELERGLGPDQGLPLFSASSETLLWQRICIQKIQILKHPVQHPLSTQHPTGLPFWDKWFSSYKSTNMLTEVAFPQENIQMSSSIKLQNRSACSCLTCTWVSLTTGHPSVFSRSMFPYYSIIFLLKKHQASEMKVNHFWHANIVYEDIENTTDIINDNIAFICSLPAWNSMKKTGCRLQKMV